MSEHIELNYAKSSEGETYGSVRLYSGAGGLGLVREIRGDFPEK